MQTPRYKKTVTNQTRAQGGHTLVELMVVLPLMTAIMLAAGSLMFAVSKSSDVSTGIVADRLDSMRHCRKMLSEVQLAVSIAQANDHSIEFSTSDRDNDGLNDTILYSWSGTAGDPLVCTINDVKTFDLVEAVNEFQVEYGKEKSFRNSILKSHDDAPGGTFEGHVVARDQVACQTFLPDLPVGADRWSLEKIRVMARSFGAPGGTFQVSIAKSDQALQPLSSKIESVTFDEHELDDQFSWFDISFSNTRNLLATDAYCVSIESVSGEDASIELCLEKDAVSMTPNTSWVTSSNNGLTWTPPNDLEDLRFYAIGTHNGANLGRTALELVQINLQVGDDATASCNSSTKLVNLPEMRAGNPGTTDTAADQSNPEPEEYQAEPGPGFEIGGGQ